MTLPTVHVIGLGPAGPDLITAGALQLIAQVPVQFLRTVRHPAASAMPTARSCDAHYEQAEHIGDVYVAIVEEVVAAAAECGEVLYGVPGSPVVAEHTVELLLADERVRSVVHPALSFADLTWVRLGIDPVAAGVRIVDAHRFAEEAAGDRGPLLVCQVDSTFALSDVKLAVEDPPTSAILLQRLGLPDESIQQVAWDDLDRVVDPDHLTSLWIPELGSPIAADMVRLVELVRVLRAEDPWKAAQTPISLQPFLLEESHEVLEALDAVDLESGDGTEELAEELGDLLYQVVLHSALGAEAGWFDLSDVTRGIHEKLVERHPHVFDPARSNEPEPTIDELVVGWEAAKRTQKQRSSIFDGLPDTLPALARSAKVSRKAAVLIGSDPSVESVLSDLGEALESLESSAPDDASIGELLSAIVELAAIAGIDPEGALRRATDRRVQQLRSSEISSEELL